jgi:hypothetical protein
MTCLLPAKLDERKGTIDGLAAKRLTGSRTSKYQGTTRPPGESLRRAAMIKLFNYGMDCAILIRRNGDLIVGVILVPLDFQLPGALANVLTVDDRTRENAGDFQPIGKGRRGPEANGQVAVQVDAGRECTQPLHLDGAAGSVELDDLTAQLLDGLVQGPFHDAGRTGGGSEELRFLNGVSLLDTGTVGIDCLDGLASFKIRFFFRERPGQFSNSGVRSVRTSAV